MKITHIYRPAIIEGEVAKLPLGVGAKDGYAIVDKEDAHLDKYKWRKNAYGYAVGHVNGRDTKLHRLLMNPGKDEVVDHINHDPLDNRKSNLRVCSQVQNMWNQRSKKVASSGYKGVNHYKRYDKFAAHITLDHKKYHLGYFSDAIDAAKAYDAKAKEFFGEFAQLNFKESIGVNN